jgi:nicotinamide-nucleotide amidase
MAKKLIAEAEAQLQNILGDTIWGYDEDTLEDLVGSMLREKRLSLATMESCTGGLLASVITDVPRSSDYFKGGFITYSAQMKAAYGVDAELLAQRGTVDPDVALAMAKAARLNLEADIGIGITGVAGPSEIEGKPVGTVHIAIDSEKRSASVSVRFPFRREEIKRRAAYSALFKLRQLLLQPE